jgi:ribose 5-phosphate isomerase B
MKKLITEEDVKAIAKQGSNVIVKSSPEQYQKSNTNQSAKKRIAIGGDHTGFRTKNLLIKYLSEKGYKLQDFGTFDEKSCDYPDFAKLVATSVSLEENDYGILVDATGIPSAITANKIKGIRAATCYSAFSAKSSRSHNNTNILVIGAKSLGEETIKMIVDEWLNTEFEGGRHQKRLDKISEIENKFL